MSTKVRLYFSEKIQSDLISHLTEHQSHYVKDVMRLKVGDGFSIFNEQGEWNAVIENYKKGYTNIKILEKVRNKKNEKNIWLAFSLIKKNPLDMMIQKATELGIQKFIPILSERSIVRNINNERIKKIIVEASEQSNRISIPEILKLKSLKVFLKNFPKDGKLIFCDINSINSELKNSALKQNNKTPICILIGPEGDFSEIERQSIIDIDQSFSLSLASNILRAETAAIAAISVVNFYLDS